MPTIIESLIVELGLDPSDLDEGQKKAVESLRKLEQQANRSGKHIDDLGSRILAFFRFIENPARGIRQHLERLAAPAQAAKRALSDVGSQARRTGSEGQAGAAAVTSGVRALAIAGLGAIAVYKVLDKTLEAVFNSAHKTFGVGVGAAAAGLPVQEFSAISQALFTHGNAPEQETQDWLAGIKQFQENLKLGIVDQAKMAALGKLGIANPAVMTPEQILEQLAAKFATESRPEVISQGASVGLSRTQSLALRGAGANLPAEIAEARKTAVTSADTKAAGDLLNASNQLEVTYGKLYRTIMTDLDPTLIRYIRDLNTLGQTLITVTNNYQPFLVLLGRMVNLFMDLSPASWLIPGAPGRIWKDIKELSEPLPAPGAASSAAPGAAPATAPPGEGQGGSIPVAPGDRAGTAAAEDTILSQVAYNESRNNPTAQNPISTASGLYGILDGTWKEATKAIGEGQQYAHAKDAPPEIQKTAARWLLERYGPNSPHSWYRSGTYLGHPYPEIVSSASAAPASPPPATSAASAPAPAAPAAPAPAPAPAAPPIGTVGTGGDIAGTGDAATGYGPRGPLGQTTAYDNGNQDFAGGTPGRGSPWSVKPAVSATLSGAKQSMFVIPPGIAALLAGARQGAMASNGTAAGPTTHNADNSTTATFGPINVHTQATSPQGIGTAVSDTVNRNLLINQSNRGLT